MARAGRWLAVGRGGGGGVRGLQWDEMKLRGPGVLHLADNMVKEIDQSLEGWGAWLPGLCQLTYLLGVTSHREKFIRNCVLSDAIFAPLAEPNELREFKAHMSSQCRKVVGWFPRWGCFQG